MARRTPAATIRIAKFHWRRQPTPVRGLGIPRVLADIVWLYSALATNRRAVTLRVTDAGKWRTGNRAVSKLLNTVFNPEWYRPSQAYSPRGTAVAIAVDVASVLGGDLRVTRRGVGRATDRYGKQIVY